MMPTSPTPAPQSPGGDITRRTEEACRIRLAQFDGPLDLLLHLVRVNQLDVADLPIVEIARQYDEYLEMMREVNLEVAGDYLVMAATLVHIKSRILLPPDPASAEEQRTDDPRADLSRQLQDYQRFKMAAESLQALESVRSLIWTPDGRVPPEFAGEELLSVDLVDLVAAFRGLLARLGEEARLQLRRDDVSVADRIEWLAGVLERRGSAGLLDLLAGLESSAVRIATFLAVLEMVRLQLIVAFQRAAFGEIRIARRAESAGAARSSGEP